jgi:hypothetical protein
VLAHRDVFAAGPLVRREPGELYLLRHDPPLRGPQRSLVGAWVERLNPLSLEVEASSERFAAGPFWPGGIACHANGDLHVVFGRWAHRLTTDLRLVASRRLAVDRPHNSFVVLDEGELVTKDCDAPAAAVPATVSVLDPETLELVAPPLRLPEPAIARLSSDGESVIAIGSRTAFRLRLDRDRERLEIDESWRPAYGDAGHSFGWDPVIADEHVFWMDNGRNHTDRTMVGSGTDAAPLRLWWARRDDGTLRSLEVSGLPYGTQSNPPAWDARTQTVVAYDAGNGTVGAWRLRGDDLEPLWRRDGLAHAGHLILYPDTGELVVGDWRDWAWTRGRLARPLVAAFGRGPGRFAAVRRASLRSGHDELAVLELATGEELGRVAVPSPSQGFLFSAPGFGRDVIYQSLTTIARVAVV